MTPDPDFDKRVLEIAQAMDWECLLNQGAGSCVASHGCAGVTQDDLYAFADAIRDMVVEGKVKDAARYCWLKEGGWITAEMFDSTVEFMGQPEDLDAAIDGAMERDAK